MAKKVNTDDPLVVADPHDPDWMQFEKYVANATDAMDPGSSTVTWNTRRPSKFSGRTRQVDVFIEGDVRGFPFSIAIECKDYKRDIGVKEVEAFIGKLLDLDVDKGAFYVHRKVTKSARKRAAGSTHPKVLLYDSVEIASTSGLSDFAESCPAENCYGYGTLYFTDWKQERGGADVEAGSCGSCGSDVFRCRDCESLEVIAWSKAECFNCGAKYEATYYKDGQLDDFQQVARQVD